MTVNLPQRLRRPIICRIHFLPVFAYIYFGVCSDYARDNYLPPPIGRVKTRVLGGLTCPPLLDSRGWSFRRMVRLLVSYFPQRADELSGRQAAQRAVGSVVVVFLTPFA